MVNQGYLYVAFGDQYIAEATQSALSLRSHSVDATIAIVTSEKNVNAVFDKIIPSDGISKIEGLLLTPFEKTFFVDTDTYFCESCDKGFDLLDYYDLCMSSAPNEIDLKLEGYRPLNSGVMLYNREVLFVLSTASEQYNSDEALSPRQGRRRDQSYIALAILDSKIRVHVLPSTWNFRSCFFTGLKGPVKIIHDRGCDMELIKSRVNKELGQRCWNPNWQNLVTSKLLL